MTTRVADTINRRRWALLKARKAELQRKMAQYDQTTFLPAMAKLREDCAEAGHVWYPHKVTANGTWLRCRHCFLQTKEET